MRQLNIWEALLIGEIFALSFKLLDRYLSYKEKELRKY